MKINVKWIVKTICYIIVIFIPFNFMYSQSNVFPGRVIVRLANGIVDNSVINNRVIPINQASIVDQNLFAAMNGLGAGNLRRIIPWATADNSVRQDWINVYVFEFNENINVNSVVRLLKQFDKVISAEPDYIVTHDTNPPNDTDFNLQYYLKNTVNSKFDIDVLTAWDYSKGENVKIGIIDWGTRTTHEDLDEHVGATGAEYGDSTGHGTKIAGIIAAVTNNDTGVAGIGWESILIPRAGLSISDKIEDIAAAVDSGGAQILNCSWHIGSTDPEYVELHNIIRQVYQQDDVVIVASMGNIDSPTTPSANWYPAKWDSFVVAVGALEKVDNGDSLKKHGNSNYGSWIDVTAPGDQLRTTTWGSDNEYGTMSKTSASTAVEPIVYTVFITYIELLI